MPAVAWSAASTRVSCTSAAFDVLYAAGPGDPMSASSEDMLTIEPPPLRSMAGIAALAHRNAPRRLTLISSSHTAPPPSRMPPANTKVALFTSTSTRPNSASTSANSAMTSASSPTSAWM